MMPWTGQQLLIEPGDPAKLVDRLIARLEERLGGPLLRETGFTLGGIPIHESVLAPPGGALLVNGDGTFVVIE